MTCIGYLLWNWLHYSYSLCVILLVTFSLEQQCCFWSKHQNYLELCQQYLSISSLKLRNAPMPSLNRCPKRKEPVLFHIDFLSPDRTAVPCLRIRFHLHCIQLILPPWLASLYVCLLVPYPLNSWCICMHVEYNHRPHCCVQGCAVHPHLLLASPSRFGDICAELNLCLGNFVL